MDGKWRNLSEFKSREFNSELGAWPYAPLSPILYWTLSSQNWAGFHLFLSASTIIDTVQFFIISFLDHKIASFCYYLWYRLLKIHLHKTQRFKMKLTTLLSSVAPLPCSELCPSYLVWRMSSFVIDPCLWLQIWI